MTNEAADNTTTLPTQLGEPISYRGITITPIFPSRDTVAEYISYAAAAGQGFTATEVDESGSVGEVRVKNPTGSRVLLYDGEEIAGAKQDRIINVAVMVEAGDTTTIPVSCIESGRWYRERAEFRPTGRTPSPQVRMSKTLNLAAAPLERGRAQSAVWDAVYMKQREHGFTSGTSKHGDLIEHERPRLEEFVNAFPLQPGQCGMVLGMNGRIVTMDVVSRPDVYADLHRPLLTGYMLDALAHVDGTAAAPEAAEEFLGALANATRTPGPSAGLGTDLRINGAGVVGSGLELDGELIQLTAFRTDGDSPQDERPTTRIARPTRRGWGH